MKQAILIILFFTIINFYSLSQIKPVKVNVIDGYPTIELKIKIEKNISGILNIFNNSHSRNDTFLIFNGIDITEKGKININEVWSISRFTCQLSEIAERLVRIANGYEIRNIPVLIDRKQEEIVIEINNSGEITDLYFSVSQHQFKNIISNQTNINDSLTFIIKNFIEALKIAYIKKDLEFIDMVYSDKALIIVGKKIKLSDKLTLNLTDTGKQSMFENGASSSYKKMTKKEYMAGLKRVFELNKRINVDFSDIEIIPHRKKGYEYFYGVRLKQKWNAGSYFDYGILFFVIEFREKDNPLIWVRVWQDAKTTSENEQIGLGEIQIQPK